MRKMFDPPAVNVPGEGQLRVEITTRLGTMKGILYENEAPKTVANFVGLATGQTTGTPFYDATTGLLVSTLALGIEQALVDIRHITPQP